MGEIRPSKLILDTNVLISALGWPGPPATILKGCLQGRYIFRTSPDLLAELVRVLRYPKLAGLAGHPALADILAFLYRPEHLVYPLRKVSLISVDPADDRVLEASLAASADYIISGDRHLLQLSIWEGIPILAPQVFVEKHPADSR